MHLATAHNVIHYGRDLFLNIQTNLISHQTSFRGIESHIFIHSILFAFSIRSLLNRGRKIGWNVTNVANRRPAEIDENTDNFSLLFTRRAGSAVKIILWDNAPIRTETIYSISLQHIFSRLEVIHLKTGEIFFRKKNLLNSITFVDYVHDKHFPNEYQILFKSDTILHQLLHVNCFQK